MSVAELARGDIAWIDDKQDANAGQPRTWLVMSDPALHRSRQLFLGVPLSNATLGWGTHVVLNPGAEAVRVAVCEQVRAIPTQLVSNTETNPYPRAKVDEVHQILVLLTSAR